MMSPGHIHSVLSCTLMFFLTARTPNAYAQDLENVRDEKSAAFHGNIGAAAYLYGVNGIAARKVPFSWLISVNTVVTVKGMELPFSFRFSEQNRDFRQPFNQFGASPKYKWATLHLGWRNVSFSKYTLDGHTFLGTGLELNPGKFRFGAMYGRLLKAVAEDTMKQVYNSVSQYPYVAYDRKGYAFKLGLGTEKNFFDLIYLKGKDDVNSLSSQPQYQLTQPGENVVAGVRSKFTFLKKIILEIDAAASAYNRNALADSIIIEDETFEKIADKIMTPRLSTNVYYAGDASLEYRGSQFGVALKYIRIAPDYKSMGIYYIQTDVERYVVAPYYNDKASTVQVNASLGLEKDNLLRKKLASTSRLMGSLNVNYNPKPEYGVSMQYSNYGIAQRPGVRSLNDTIKLDQVTQNITVAPRYMLTKTDAIHTFTYLFSDQVLNDRNRFQDAFDMRSINNTLSYMVYLIQLSVTVDVSAFYTTTKIVFGEATSIGGSIGTGKSYLKNALNSSLNITYSANAFDGAPDGNTLQFRSTHQYNVSSHHHFKADIVFTNNTTKNQLINKSFNEVLTMLSYNYTF